MKLVLVRHAIALDREQAFKLSIADSQRALTEKGIKRFHQVASQLPHLNCKIDVILSSPYIRAQQTADILHQYFPQSDVITEDRLSAGASANSMAEVVNQYNNYNSIAVVGHEPDLSAFASYLLTLNNDLSLQLKKGSICILQLSEKVRCGEAVMLDLWQPAIFRKLRKGV